MKNLAIIPARKGSKGLIDKNIKLLLDKPLMSYTIDAAIKSNMFDTIMVSTDSSEYAEIAIKYGASVPFLRSLKNSSDSAATWDVVEEVLDMYKKNNIYFDNIMILQPTSPLRNYIDIKKAFDFFVQKQAEAIVSVCLTEHSPLICNVLPQDLSMKNFISDRNLLPRQKLPDYYRINGAMYLVKTALIGHFSSIYNSDCYAYIMQKDHSVDIDDELDFEWAEFLIKKKTTGYKIEYVKKSL